MQARASKRLLGSLEQTQSLKNMPAAKDLVEQMQLQAWNRLGIPVDQIETQFKDELRRSVIALSTVDSSLKFSEQKFAELMAKDERTGKTTKYQNPFALTTFKQAWARLRQAAEADRSAKIPPNSLDPLLASAPTGDLNARVVFGDNDSMAIVLEEKLETWALCFTHAIVSLLASDKGDRVELCGETLPISDKQMELDSFAQLLIFTAATGTPSFYTDERGAAFPKTMLVPELRKLSLLARDGYITFVAAHEFAHVRLEHYEKWRTGKGPFKLPKTYEATWKKFLQTYEVLPNV